MSDPVYIEHPDLSRLTTLGLGGKARRLAQVNGPKSLARALDENGGSPVAILGSGSNLVVADRGFEGLLVRSTDQSRTYDPTSGELQVGAGTDWDELVSFTVARNAAGIECLSGIPGLCGAAPVQNIGAYGQEVGDVLEEVEAVDLADGGLHTFSAAECGLGYRRSRFKEGEAGRWAITSIRLRLRPGGAPTAAYRELQDRLAGVEPDLERVRAEVLSLRRSKSMVHDPADPNRRSAGSFFTNPVVDTGTAEEIAARVGGPMPSWPVDGDRIKLAAAWLIQNAGFEKGLRRGGVGLSSKHVLALVHHGNGTTAELLALAREIRDAVLDRFGVRLRPEPVPLGFRTEEISDLWPVQPEA
jgi:UDP-N-acetylmuramate dehydrogenase